MPVLYEIRYLRKDRWGVYKDKLELGIFERRAKAVRWIRPQIQARYNLYGEKAILKVGYASGSMTWLRETWGVVDEE